MEREGEGEGGRDYVQLILYRYVVFSHLANTEEVEKAKNLFWDHIEDCTSSSVSRHDVSSWGDGNWPADPSNGIMFSMHLPPRPFLLFSLLLPPRTLILPPSIFFLLFSISTDLGIGQSSFLWYLRTLPNVKKAFAAIWGDDDLLVSFDGCGVFRPIEYPLSFLFFFSSPLFY